MSEPIPIADHHSDLVTSLYLLALTIPEIDADLLPTRPRPSLFILYKKPQVFTYDLFGSRASNTTGFTFILTKIIAIALP